jgi:hypothetical protein
LKCGGGVDRLDPSLTINSITETPQVRYKGGDADGTDWDHWTYGEAIDLQSGTAPSYNQGSPGYNTNDDSVLFNTGGYYMADDFTTGQVATEDFVIETIFQASPTNATMIFNATRASGIGFQIYMTGANQLNLYIVDAGGNDTVSSVAFVIPEAWYHAMFFMDRSGSGQLYLDGVANGAAVDISGTSGTLNPGNRSFTLGARSNGTNPYDRAIAYYALWKRAAWLDTHLQATVAKERFEMMSCIYAGYAHGSNVTQQRTRATDAYLQKIESGTRKVYLVDGAWIRISELESTDGETLQGMQSEASITNKCTYFDDFAGADWTIAPYDCSISSDELEAPDRQRHFDGLVADNGAGQDCAVAQPNITSTGVLSWISVIAKKGSDDFLAIKNGGVANTQTWFDLANGTVETEGAAATGYIEDLGGDIYLCGILHTSVNGANTIEYRSAAADTGTTVSGDGSTVNTYLYGSQWEEGTESPTSRMVTTASTGVRSDDRLRYVGDDGNLGGVGSDQQGFIEFDFMVPDADHASDLALITISDGGAAADMIDIYVDSANDRVFCDVAATAGNAGQVSVATDVTNNKRYRVRVSWETDNLQMSVNGVHATADTTVDIPDNLDRISVGQSESGGSKSRALIGNVKIWDRPRAV